MNYCQTCGEDETCCKCSIVSHPSEQFDCGFGRGRKSDLSHELLEENRKLKAEIRKIKKQFLKKKK